MKESSSLKRLVKRSDRTLRPKNVLEGKEFERIYPMHKCPSLIKHFISFFMTKYFLLSFVLVSISHLIY